MFTKTSKLKSIFKDAYRDFALDVGLTQDDVWLIRTHNIAMEVPKENMDNEVLGEIVRLTGALPEKGEAWTYRDGHAPQSTTIDFIYENLWNQWNTADITVQQTRMAIVTQGTQYVYQEVNGLRKFMIPADEHDCYGFKGKTEEAVRQIKMTPLGDVIVVSNEMALRLSQHKLQWKQEKQILDQCKDIDLNWSSTEVNRL